MSQTVRNWIVRYRHTRRLIQMPNETMLEVLLWLDRFDLDVKQITARSLRSLVENNQCRFEKWIGWATLATTLISRAKGTC